MHFMARLTGPWLLVAICASGIFIASSLSQPPMVSTWDLPHLDKLYHAIAYSALTFALIRALYFTCATRPITPLLFSAAVMTVVYGVFDECHQAFTPYRVMSLYDLLADATGAGIGVATWLWAQRRRPASVKS
jgi:VanZ family protein